MSLRTLHRRNQRNRRGTAYVLVLAITTLLVTLGIAATQLAKGQIEAGELDQDQSKSRLTALAMQDILHKQNSGSTTWRDGLESKTFYFFGELDGVKVWYAYEDEVDDDLDDDYTDPVVLYTVANSGIAFRIYSAEYFADSAGNLTRNALSFKQDVLTP